MTTLIYAGIGSRATPESILADMTTIAGWLARTGWHLASGGADGADTAFAGGAPAGHRTLSMHDAAEAVAFAITLDRKHAPVLH